MVQNEQKFFDEGVFLYRQSKAAVNHFESLIYSAIEQVFKQKQSQGTITLTKAKPVENIAGATYRALTYAFARNGNKQEYWLTLAADWAAEPEGEKERVKVYGYIGTGNKTFAVTKTDGFEVGKYKGDSHLYGFLTESDGRSLTQAWESLFDALIRQIG